MAGYNDAETGYAQGPAGFFTHLGHVTDITNKFDKDATPASGDVPTWNGTVYAPGSGPVVTLTDPVGGGGDDTAAVQAVIDAAPNGSRIVGRAGKTYSVSNIAITNKTGVIFDGQGSKLLFRSTGARVGVQLAGTCTGVEVCNWQITGNAVVGDAHAGVYCNSGQTIVGCTVRNNIIRDVTLGISFSADGGGSINGLLIQGNDLENIVGTAPGTGYGINHGGSSATPANVRIIGNRISRAQRHSIYQSKGAGVIIANNTIHSHRLDVADGVSTLTAVMIARSADILFIGNTITDYSDGALYLAGVDVGTFAQNYRVIGNLFLRQLNSVNTLYIGALTPTTDSPPTDIVVAQNSFRPNLAAGTTSIHIYNGKRMQIVDNYIYNNATTSSNGIRLAGTGETGATNTYSDDITIARNYINVVTGTSIRLSGTETTIITLRFIDNLLLAPSPWTIASSITNPNMTARGSSVAGLTGWPDASIQFFTANGTWTMPEGAKAVHVIAVGGGAGGGSGRRGAAGTVRCGGGGGGGGGLSFRTIPAAVLSATETVTVGTGGAGGTAITANDTDGNAGTGGGLTTFGTHVKAFTTSGGGGGTATAGTAGGSGAGQFAGAAGAAASGSGGVGGTGPNTSGVGGGGAGGGITSGDSPSAGGAGSLAVSVNRGASAGAAINTSATPASAPPVGSAEPGSGGGGGGGSIVGVAGSGAAGTIYGAGGGGGGASLNGNNSGAGGAGAVGCVIVITTF